MRSWNRGVTRFECGLGLMNGVRVRRWGGRFWVFHDEEGCDTQDELKDDTCKCFMFSAAPYAFAKSRVPLSL